MEVLYRKLASVFILFFMMVSIAYADSDTNAAGQVIVVSGPFQAINTSKDTRNLDRGGYFYSGDTLVTGTNATAQVRFTDGTVMALNPNSQIKVNEYSYNKDAKNDKSSVSLVKGGFRALTGLMSKDNPDSYKVETPVAVIGVRGTNYSAILQVVKNNKKDNKKESKKEGNKEEKVALYAGAWDGNITLTNESNQSHPLVLGKGNDYNFAVVDSKNSAPVGLLNPPAQLVHQCGIRDAARTNL